MAAVSLFLHMYIVIFVIWTWTWEVRTWTSTMRTWYSGGKELVGLGTWTLRTWLQVCCQTKHHNSSVKCGVQIITDVGWLSLTSLFSTNTIRLYQRRSQIHICDNVYTSYHTRLQSLLVWSAWKLQETKRHNIGSYIWRC